MIKQTWTAGLRVAAAAGLLFVGSSIVASAKSFNCPVAQMSNSPGVLKESSTQIAAAGHILTNGNSANRASEVVFNLRKRYPGAADAEIENYLIAAYCPAIAKLGGLTVAERQARVSQFARSARLAVYGR